MIRKIDICKVAFIAMLSISGFSACKKEDQLPGDRLDTYINFCNLAEALNTNNQLSLDNRLLSEQIYGTRPLQFPFDGEVRQVPSQTGISDLTPDGLSEPLNLNYTSVFWLPVRAGNFHLSYTSDSTLAVIKDTTVDLQPKTFITQYLVENIQSDEGYSIFSFPANLTGISGKVQVQLLNLSPDFGALQVDRIDDKGHLITSDLPVSLPSGGSNTSLLDTAGAAATRNMIWLKFHKPGQTNALLIQTVPAVSGSCFQLVFRGFESTTNRRIKMRNNQYQQVAIASNLRVSVRRLH
ncbi:hypothetical protein [Chitinophaga sp. 212800010-3]|uniref:hypothetical protein n=1 Tax=unclassified Chitinophaga TaxID=2619133 RepID=UPI002DE33832|nr:hypothetical protein [Chitinophaga sp. 212800010-3]